MESHDLLNVAKTSFMMNMKTGNMLVDMALQTLIIAIIGYLTVHLKTFLTKLKEWYYRDGNNKVSVTTTVYYTLIDQNLKITPTSLYAAVSHRLHTYAQNDQPGFNVTSLADSDDPNRLPPLNIKIKLEDHVYGIFTSDIVEGTSSSIMAGIHTSGSTMRINRLTCTVYSHVLTMSQMLTFVEKLKTEYSKYIIRLNQSPTRRLYICKTPGNFNSYIFQTTRSFDNVFFEQKEMLSKQLNFFLNHQEWYEQVGSPYTLGLCFSGPPGTGKTSCIKAIAKHTNRHIVMVSLRDLKTYEDVIAIFSGLALSCGHPSTSQMIFVIEDIDCVGSDVVLKRESLDESEDYTRISTPTSGTKVMSDSPKTDKTSFRRRSRSRSPDKTKLRPPSLTLSDLLNAIDGVLEFSGRILIFTTNHPEKLDPALLRPGRIDLNIVLGKATLRIVSQIIRHFFQLDASTAIDLDPRVDQHFTAAEVTCLCKQFVETSYLEIVHHLNNLASTAPIA